MSDSTNPTKVILGNLSEVALFDLVQFLNANRKSGLLTLRGKSERGFIYFEDGAIVNAIGDDLSQGVGVLKTFFHWKEGTFEFDSQQLTSEYTIQMPTDSLLFDIAKEMDEDLDESAPTDLQAPPENALKDIFSSAVNRQAMSQPVQDDGNIALGDLLAFFIGLDVSGMIVSAGRKMIARTPAGLKPVGKERVNAAQMTQLLTATAKILKAQGQRTAGFYAHETLGTFWLSHFADCGGRCLEVYRISDDEPDPLIFNLWPGSLEKILNHEGPALLLGNRIDNLVSLGLAAAVALAGRGQHVTCYQTVPTHTLDQINGYVRLQRPLIRAGGVDIAATLDGTDPTDAVILADPLGIRQLGELSSYPAGDLPIIATALFTDYHNRPLPDTKSDNKKRSETHDPILAISVHSDDASGG